MKNLRFNRLLSEDEVLELLSMMDIGSTVAYSDDVRMDDEFDLPAIDIRKGIITGFDECDSDIDDAVCEECKGNLYIDGVYFDCPLYDDGKNRFRSTVLDVLFDDFLNDDEFKV